MRNSSPYRIPKGIIPLILIAPVLLLSVGCGGGSTDTTTSSSTNGGTGSTGPDAPPPVVTPPSAGSYVLTGVVVSEGNDVDNIPILVAPSGGAVGQGYARAITSDGGKFSIIIPWSSVVVVANNQKIAGAVQVTGPSSSAQSKAASHAEFSTQVPMQDVTQYAVANPPSSFPPADFSDSVSFAQPRFLPQFLGLFEAFLKEAFGLAVSTHFIERLFERDITMDEVITAIEYGKVFYDPANDSLVYYANRVAVAITSDFSVIKTLFRGPVQSGWQLLEEDVPPVIEGLRVPRVASHSPNALRHVL